MHTIEYDIATLPSGLSMDTVIAVYVESGIVLYDSTIPSSRLHGCISGNSPKILAIDENCDIKIKFIDCGK